MLSGTHRHTSTSTKTHNTAGGGKTMAAKRVLLFNEVRATLRGI